MFLFSIARVEEIANQFYLSMNSENKKYLLVSNERQRLTLTTLAQLFGTIIFTFLVAIRRIHIFSAKVQDNF